MTGLTVLWLPIFLSAVVVFVASSIIHMATTWHKSDCPKLPDEEKIMGALRPFAIPPGDYLMPRPADAKEMRSPEFAEKRKRGPVMVFTIMRADAPMAKSFISWFAYCIVIGIFAGYIAGRALPPGSPYLSVFRFVGASAFLGYSAALWQSSIWYQRKWSTTIKLTVDGLIFALLTAGVFGWLWPR